MIRQGEICLIPAGISDDLRVTAVNEALLGIGETGNAHVLTAIRIEWLHQALEDINAVQKSGIAVAQHSMYVRVSGNGVITHSDRHGHEQAPVPDGTYLVRVKREQLPWEAEARAVYD